MQQHVNFISYKLLWTLGHHIHREVYFHTTIRMSVVQFWFLIHQKRFRRQFYISLLSSCKKDVSQHVYGFSKLQYSSIFQELCNARKREVESEDHLKQVGKFNAPY